MKKITLLTAALLVGLTAFAETKITYSFDNDVAGTTAITPPAANTSILTANGGTAGVVSYAGNDMTSNCLKMYTGGVKNLTGVLNLNSFPSNATDYSVIWKEYLSVASEAKFGVLLRGNNPSQDANTGYAPGIMEGYYVMAYINSQLQLAGRIYKTSAAAGLTRLDPWNSSVYTISSIGTPTWLKATVSGVSPVTISIACSTDSVAWNTLLSFNDASATPYTSGSTQLVWGIAAQTNDYRLDNITYYSSSVPTGVEATKTSPVVVSEEYYTLTGEKISHSLNDLRGLYILRQHLSDGTVQSSKVLLK
ncbi:hypothetical protein [Parabacteroides sp. FAFU027]|uniref:hypothetical protein n=1 Tax=Parabacteroides sp. FAFU027 TaxID=2922715 RepID=UPI001FAEC9A0|nr:hypothetical protein [Parabacteroides sp. FAFU027]